MEHALFQRSVAIIVDAIFILLIKVLVFVVDCGIILRLLRSNFSVRKIRD